MTSEGLAAFGAVEREAQTAAVAFDDLAAHQPSRIDHVDHGRFPGAENRDIEQQPGEHFLVAHRLRHMVDRGEAGAALLSADGLELDFPDSSELALAVDEVDDAPAYAADRRDRQLAGAMALLEQLGAE